MPLVVYVTKSIVPATGLHINPRIPLPNPKAPPLNPPFLAPLTGSMTTPTAALTMLSIIDLVPRATPDTILEGTSLLCMSLGTLYPINTCGVDLAPFPIFSNETTTNDVIFHGTEANVKAIFPIILS